MGSSPQPDASSGSTGEQTGKAGWVTPVSGSEGFITVRLRLRSGNQHPSPKSQVGGEIRLHTLLMTHCLPPARACAVAHRPLTISFLASCRPRGSPSPDPAAWSTYTCGHMHADHFHHVPVTVESCSFNSVSSFLAMRVPLFAS